MMCHKNDCNESFLFVNDHIDIDQVQVLEQFGIKNTSG